MRTLLVVWIIVTGKYRPQNNSMNYMYFTDVLLEAEMQLIPRLCGWITFSDFWDDQFHDVLLHQGNEWTVPRLTVRGDQEHVSRHDNYARFLEGRWPLNIVSGVKQRSLPPPHIYTNLHFMFVNFFFSKCLTTFVLEYVCQQIFRFTRFCANSHSLLFNDVHKVFVCFQMHVRLICMSESSHSFVCTFAHCVALKNI